MILMEAKDVLLKLRTEHGLSQDALAEELFVTRQAVSRWERGDTLPNPETLKLLSKLYDATQTGQQAVACAGKTNVI